MFPRDTPSHSDPSVTNVTMLFLLRLLTLAGRKAVIRLSQDSDWAGAGSALAAALCISQGWPCGQVSRVPSYTSNANELFFSLLTGIAEQLTGASFLTLIHLIVLIFKGFFKWISRFEKK